jgi:hypothetical protein
VEYCAPESLAYAESAWPFESGAALTFDESYRLAHLPLVNPAHPRLIAAAPGLDYQMGRYERLRYSLIVPVDAAELEQGDTFQAMERDLRGRRFATKVAWSLARRRASKLHLTLAGGLREAALEGHAARLAELLAARAPLHYRLGGPFVSSKNRGRIYFPAYPQLSDHGNVFGLIQQALGAPLTRFYAVGHYNLSDELSAPEAADLQDFVARWGQRTLAELTVPALVLLATHDDLALDSRVVHRIEASS